MFGNGFVPRSQIGHGLKVANQAPSLEMTSSDPFDVAFCSMNQQLNFLQTVVRQIELLRADLNQRQQGNKKNPADLYLNELTSAMEDHLILFQTLFTTLEFCKAEQNHWKAKHEEYLKKRAKRKENSPRDVGRSLTTSNNVESNGWQKWVTAQSGVVFPGSKSLSGTAIADKSRDTAFDKLQEERIRGLEVQVSDWRAKYNKALENNDSVVEEIKEKYKNAMHTSQNQLDDVKEKYNRAADRVEELEREDRRGSEDCADHGHVIRDLQDEVFLL
eukprot:Platyproteum_vivax@DN16768_c0_g1_i1.p1